MRTASHARVEPYRDYEQMHFSPIKTVQLPTSVSARRAKIADRHPPRSRLVTRGCQQQNSLTLPTATPRHHPHCNGANKAALRLARLGLPVKMMIGGVTGWIDEGFALTPS